MQETFEGPTQVFRPCSALLVDVFERRSGHAGSGAGGHKGLMAIRGRRVGAARAALARGGWRPDTARVAVP
jgi:hypothetical protein